MAKSLGAGGAWVAQSIECLTLDPGSGLDLTVMSSSPTMGMEPTLKKKKKDGFWSQYYFCHSNLASYIS